MGTAWALSRVSLWGDAFGSGGWRISVKIPWGVAAVTSVAFFVVVSCGPKVPKLVEMTNAPAFGSSPSLNSLDTFIVGTWGLKTVTDAALAKQLGLSSLASDASDPDVTDVFTFKTGGAFTCKMPSFKHKVEGTWASNQGVLTLTFTTIDGQPIASEMDRVKKGEEHGGQGEIIEAMVYEGAQNEMNAVGSWTLGTDKKCLEVPQSPDALFKNPLQLVRMGPEEEK